LFFYDSLWKLFSRLNFDSLKREILTVLKRKILTVLKRKFLTVLERKILTVWKEKFRQFGKENFDSLKSEILTVWKEKFWQFGKGNFWQFVMMDTQTQFTYIISKERIQNNFSQIACSTVGRKFTLQNFDQNFSPKWLHFSISKPKIFIHSLLLTLKIHLRRCKSIDTD
jgi:hypothetical protein